MHLQAPVVPRALAMLPAGDDPGEERVLGIVRSV